MGGVTQSSRIKKKAWLFIIGWNSSEVKEFNSMFLISVFFVLSWSELRVCPSSPSHTSPADQTAGNQQWFSKQVLNQWCSEARNTGQSKPITFKQPSSTSTPLVQPLGYDIRKDRSRWREGLTKTQKDNLLITNLKKDCPQFTVDAKLGLFKGVLHLQIKYF